MSSRLRAYGYGLVTTGFFLFFALAESATQNFVTAHAPVAGTAIGIAIIVVLALAFRPIHRRVESAIEAVFTRRRREARAAVDHLRKELTSFNDAQQVLRRVVGAVDHHMGTDGCAIYLRHDAYDVAASTFDIPAPALERDDPLVVRLRSSVVPADPHALGSPALGELAFPMMAGGELVGILTLAPKHVALDGEDRHALAILAEAAAVALLALDPRLRTSLRKTSNRPNNLPRASTSFVGRADEVAAVAVLVRNNPLVSIVGAGGMGKTRLALQVASHLLDETTEGAWFVDLAPIGDGSLVASAILTVLEADQSGEADPLERVVAYLKPRALLLVLDNSEHLIADIARVVEAIVTNCPNVAVLATTRESLGLRREVVHRIASLDAGSAVELFAQRAAAVNERFELTATNRPIVAEICKHLDGMALAIELAAARVRSISVDELSHRLQLRVLGGSGREPLARHKTIYALVDWSYDLLADDEKRLFVELSAFVGGVTLEAAAATFCREGLDDWQLLDLVTSLVDKSLLVADVEETSQRYRFLEPIREYAAERLERQGEKHAVFHAYARTFAEFADRTYEEFDAGPRADWLERNAREIDNVRAAMRWALAEGDDRELAVRIAGGFGVVFLRLTLLQEGIDWCRRAFKEKASFDPVAGARLRYVFSMLCNNQGHYADALAAAQDALAAYRAAGDARGIARALSQVAQQLENTGRSEQAVSTAEEAVVAARRLDDPGLLASVLLRAGNAYAPSQIGLARKRFDEAAALYRGLGREAERARVLSWWADSEYCAGEFRAAARLIEEALAAGTPDLLLSANNLAANVYWALGDRDRAEPATRQAFALAREGREPVYLADALLWMAMLAAETDPAQSARLLGYAQRQRERFKAAPPDGELLSEFLRALRKRLGDDRSGALLLEGAAWNEEQALLAGSAL